MWTALLHKPSTEAIIARHARPLGGFYWRLCTLMTVCVLAACTAPVFPDNTPTKAEVPFLGAQLTQQEIATWAAQIAQQRQTYDKQWVEAKKACYQRFFVNACLHQALEAHRRQSAVLRKQDIELNRQRRFLQEIDRQLRLQKNQHELKKSLI